MNKLGVIILIILVIGIVISFSLFYMKGSVAKANTPIQINYETKGVIEICNTSAISPFLSNYINVSYFKFVSQVIEYGIVKFILINQTRGIIGYFKAGPLSSLAFVQLNQTLTSHGFKYAEYHSLLYDYNVSTAIGFDGYYFYLVHDNSTNLNLTLTLLYYLYLSNKTFTPTVSGIVAKGNFTNGNFTVYSNSSNLIVKGYFKGNFTKLEKILRFFNFTTVNFTIAGKVVSENSSVVIYSLTATYKDKSVYAVITFYKEQEDIYFEAIISPKQ